MKLAATLILAGASLFTGQVLQGSTLRKAQIQRLVYTAIGFGLIVIWATPWPGWLGVSEDLFDQDPNLALLSFALTGPLVILGAILVVIFNADAWTWAVNRVLGGIGALTPVLRTAVAYPLNARFRSGMTMLLFAMVISTVTIMSIVIAATETLVEPDPEQATGFDIQVSFSLLSFFDPVEDLKAEIAAHPDFAADTVAAVGSIITRRVDAQQLAGAPRADSWRSASLSGVNRDYLDQAQQFYRFQLRAPGYPSDEAVWQALRERSDVAVVTASLAEAGRVPFHGGGPPGPEFDGRFRGWLRLDGIDPDAQTLPEIDLALRFADGSGQPATVRVIGVLAEADMLASGSIQANEALLDALNGEPLNPENYYVKVSETADVRAVAAELERAFLGNALETLILAEANAAAQAVTGGILRLFQGFLALGLLVGIAALGVISTRSVVERRQQVGVLRAIGYQSNMVALSFLLESAFIALTGIAIGVVAGAILGRQIVAIFFQSVSPDQTFALPWLQIGGIVLAAYLFSLLTTLLPAYQASRIYPAEALRYE